MFFYERLLDRDYVARTLMVLARRMCGYSDPKDQLKRVICDCKYGIADHPDEKVMKHHSEQTGCPELSALEEVVKHIPQRDWERLFKRALKSYEREARARRNAAARRLRVAKR